MTGAKFEGDRETWDPASCRRARLAGADGSARELTAWTAVWGASLSYPRALVAALWREPFERPFDERMTGTTRGPGCSIRTTRHAATGAAASITIATRRSTAHGTRSTCGPRTG